MKRCCVGLFKVGGWVIYLVIRFDVKLDFLAGQGADSGVCLAKTVRSSVREDGNVLDVHGLGWCWERGFWLGGSGASGHLIASWSKIARIAGVGVGRYGVCGKV